MIKNMKWMISATLILCGTMTAQAAQDEKNGTPFFTSEELPNIANFLPAPPEFESAAFVYDQTQHLWGKLQRQNEERAQMAINDAVFGMQTIIDIYGPMFGLDITKEDTPEIYKLLQDVSCTKGPRDIICACAHTYIIRKEHSYPKKRRNMLVKARGLQVTLHWDGQRLCC